MVLASMNAPAMIAPVTASPIAASATRPPWTLTIAGRGPIHRLLARRCARLGASPLLSGAGSGPASSYMLAISTLI